MTGRPWVLAESPWKVVEEVPYDVAVLPWGATEAHNRHLPYATDTIQSERLSIAAAGRAWEAGARTVVLPAVPFGVNTGQLDIKLCLNMNPSTQAALLADLVDALSRQRVRKLVIVNGHGGNDFKPMIRELQPRTDVFLCLINWYTVLEARQYFDEPGDHAGEMETSLLMHFTPDLVLPLQEAGPGHSRQARITGMRDGWVWAPRPWTQVTSDTGVGDPSRATAEKGQRFAVALVERMAMFLVELAQANTADLYG
ncbi:MAG TPA: creatininase family protein [Gemmatimonadaceae bacterium]|nr:creatininase family protein [Gemmatimonadaceae bacterium]